MRYTIALPLLIALTVLEWVSVHVEKAARWISNAARSDFRKIMRWGLGE